jgi:hypothetical protein
MASRTLRAETMRTLWDTILLPSRNDAPFYGSYEEYKEFLQRMLEGEGAKHIRYVDHLRIWNKAGRLTSTCNSAARYIIHPWDDGMDRTTWENFAQYFEGLISERQCGGRSISPTLTALKASVWLEAHPDWVYCDPICYLHQGFRWGYRDMDEMLRQIALCLCLEGYLSLLGSLAPRLDIDLSHCPLPLESTLSERLEFTSLVIPTVVEPVLYPAGLGFNLEWNERLDDEQKWSRMVYIALKALYSLVIARNIAERIQTPTELHLWRISKKGAITTIKTVS